MLELRVCGGVEIVVAGTPLADSLIGGRQGRLVLAYLACERERAVRREELAALLWGDHPPESWTASLSAVISRLRRLFTEAGVDGANVVASTPGAYQLHLPEGSRVDIEDLVAAVGDAEQGAARGEVDAALLAAGLAEAIAARGFIPDDCEWVDSRRDAIRDLRVRAAVAQSVAHLAGGASGRSIEAARLALELDETKEAAYRQLMLALAGAGERAEALRVWERCRITLVEELGTDPSPETEAVYLSLLDTNTAAAAPASTTTELPSGVVTFLLTDIVESSAMWERHATAMATALERHDALVGAVVAAHGGTLLKSKLEGDATVSVFARTTGCAAAALALLDALESEPWPEGARPRLRMAMHTGEAFERGGDYFGPALNRAARLRGLAEANEVLLSQAVAELVRDHLPEGVVLRERGLQNLRGLSRGENVFELTRSMVAASDDATVAVDAPPDFERPPVPTALPASGPFVGRGDEVAQLDGLWQCTVAGDASAVFVGGEPGVGKSRLAGEIAHRAHASGGLVLYGRCDEDLAAPLQPFIEAVRVLAPALGPARLRAVRGIDELTRVVPELSELLGEQPASRADPDTERLALFDAITQLLASTSVEVPVLLVLDDLHWAGKTTLSLLRHVLRGVKGSRVLVVGTYRDTELARTHPLAETLADLRRDSDTHRITLSGLEPDDVAAYLTAIGNDDRALGRELAEVTAGNPFFLIEVVRHVEESGGSWQPGSLPEGVRETTGRRLSRLSDAANEALSVAAVVGTTFDLALVEQVRGTELIDPIAEAVQAGLVVEEQGSFARFRFAHAIVRQVLLSELVSLKRVRLHRTIAELLEDAPGTDPDARLADLAYHWFECASAGSADKAVDACRRAADRAVERLAYEEAGDLYGMALQALEWIDGADAELGAALHLARCDALLTAGDVTGARDALDALEVAAAGSERLAAWYTTYEGLLAVLGEPERLTEIVQSIGAAAGAMRDVGDLTGEAKARYVHASALERLGQIGAAERALDAALAAARNAGDRRLADAILAEAPPAALWGPSPVTRASGRCLDVVRVLRITSGTPAVEAVALRCQAVLEALRGRMDAARRMINSSRRTVEELGLTHRRLEADFMAGLIELLDGQATEAEEHLRTAYEGLRERGLGGEAAQAGAFLGRALLLQDRIDEADAVASEAEALAGSDLKAAITWRDVRAEAAARRGDIDRALALARESVELATSTDALLLVADARLTLAAVLRAAGEPEAADAEAQRAVEACESKGATVMADLARGAMSAPAPGSAAEAHVPGSVLAGARPAPNAALESAIRSQEAFNRGDWEAERAIRAGKVVDRRPVVGLTFFSEDAHGRTVYAGGGRLDPPELVASRGERIALCRWNLRSPDIEVPFLAISGLDADGRVAAFVMFEPEAIDEAIAALDELAAEAAFENDATAAYRSMCEAFNAHDWDALMDGLAENYHSDDRRRVVGALLDHDQSLENSRVVFDGGGTFEWETVATRGRTLALMRVTLHLPELDAGDTVLSIVLTDPTGRRRKAVVFDADALGDAYAELDRMYLEGEAAEHTEVVRAVTSFFAELPTDDPAAARARMTPDFSFRSHRKVRSIEPEQDRAAFVDAVAPNLEAFRGGAARVDHVQHVSHDGGLWMLTVRGEDADAGHFEVPFLMVVGVASGRISTIDAFDDHDVDAARALLEERRDPRTDAFENDATRYEARMLAAYRSRDWNAAVALYTDDYVQEDRRSMVRVTLDREQALAGIRLIFEGGGQFDFETVATRGRSLLLSRWVLSVPDFEALAPVLVVNRVDDAGRLVHSVLFDPDDLDGARAELDRQYLQGEAAEHANVMEVMTALLDALRDSDWAAVESTLSSEFVFTSQRELRFQERFGREEWLANLRTAFALFGGLAVLRVEHVSDVSSNSGLWSIRVTGTNADGGPYEIFLLFAAHVVDNLVTAIESFDEHDFDAARATVSAGATPAWFENDATRALACFHAAFPARDWDALTSLVADEYVVHDRRSIVGTSLDHDQAVASLRIVFEGGGGFEDETIATRGRTLTLTRITLHVRDPEAVDSVLSIAPVDEQGRLLAGILFDADDVDGALTELDRLFLEGEGAAHADVIGLVHSLFDSLRRRDTIAACAVLGPGFVAREHGAAAAPDLSAEEWVASLLGTLDVFGSVEARVVHVADLTRHGGLWAMITHGEDTHGGSFELPWLMAVRVANGRIASIDSYGGHSVDEARATLALGERASDWWENDATHATSRVEAGFATRDLAAIEAVYGDEWVLDDRRAVVGASMTIEQSRAQNRLIFDGGATFGHKVLATRGRSLSLERWDLWLADHEAGETVLTITLVDDAGLYELSVMFDRDDNESAFAELDRLYVEGEGAAHADLIALGASFFEALIRQDVASVASFLAPDFRVRSYRYLRATDEQSAEEFLADLAAGFAQLSSGSVRIEHLTRVSSDAGLWFVLFTGLDKDGGPYEMAWAMVLHFTDGRIVGLDGYDEENVADALAALDAEACTPDDLVAEWIENDASRAARAWCEASNRRDRDAYFAALDPDLVWIDHREGVRLEQAGDTHQIMFDIDEFRLERGLLATRGERLALLRDRAWFVDGDAGPSEVETLTVVETGPSGRIVANIVFGPDEMVSALDFLDARFAEQGHSDFSPVRKSFDGRDWDAFASVLAPDCTVIDSRTAGWGAIDRETFVDYERTLADLSSDARIRLDHSRGRGRVTMSVGRHFGTHEGAPWEIAFVTIGVATPSTGAAQHFENYELADFTLALERFQALAGQYPDEPAENAAWRTALRHEDALNRRDWQALTAMFAPGFVQVEQQHHLKRHGDEVLATYRALFALDEFETRRTLIATRDDQLALMRVLTTFRDGEAGPAEVEAFSLVEIDDEGLIVRIDSHFSDEVTALAELDARHTELLAEEQGNTAWRAAVSMWNALNRRDWHDFTATLASGFAQIEKHHHLRLEGDDALSPYRVMFTLDEYKCRLTLVETRGERLVLVRSVTTIRDRQAGPAEVDTFAIYEVDDDGLILRIDVLPPEENAARAALDARDGAPVSGNAASRAALSAVEALNGRDWDAFIALLHPDLTYVDHHHFLHQGGDDALGTYRILVKLDDFRFERTLLSTRGDRLALLADVVTFRDGDAGPAEVEAYNIYEVDERGLVTHILAFARDEGLEAVYEELEARAVALDADPLAIPRNRAARAVEQDGWTLISALEENLCIHQTPEGFVLHEVDEAGAVVDSMEYAPDELGAAASEISRRLYARLTSLSDLDMTAALNAHDIDAARESLADDCVFEDHQELRLVEFRTPEEHLESMRAVMEIAPDYVVLTRRVFALEEWGQVVMTGAVGTTIGGGPFEQSVIAVGTWNRDGLQTYVGVYDPDDLDAALANFRSRAPHGER